MKALPRSSASTRWFILGVLATLAAISISNAMAGNGIGAVFNIGRANRVDKISRLVGSAPTTAMLRVTNSGGGPALDLRVAAGKAPLKVLSRTRVKNLNVDLLDGIDSTGFLAFDGKAVDSDKLDGLDSTEFLASGGKAVDSDLLDGVDSTGFLLVGGTAANSNQLGGLPPASYQLHSAIHLVAGTAITVVAASDNVAVANCAASEVAIAGGVRWDVGGPVAGLTIGFEGPSARLDGTIGAWRVQGHNGTASSRMLTAYALCIDR